MTLSSPTRFATKIPSPKVPGDVPSADTPRGELNIDTCSEYTKYHATVDYFKKSGKLRLIHGAAGQPVVFVINDSDELCVLQLGAKGCEGWSSTVITPIGFTVATYDIVVAGVQSLIAVACKKRDDAGTGHQLFFSSMNLTHLEDNLTSLTSKDGAAQAWTLATANTKNPIGELSMTSVLCKINGPLAGPQTKFQIVVGSKAANDRIATLYTVEPEAQSGEFWSTLSYPAAATSIAQVEPLALGQAGMADREVGLVSRFTDFSAGKSDRLAGHVYAKEGGVIRTFEFKTSKLGSIRNVFSHSNPWGLTDVFVTGERGIGFYDSKAIDVLATAPILEDKSFQQVLASEAADPARPMEQSKIAIFALSDDHSLYYIEATRDFKTRAITFQHSGIPIRENIFQMSSMYSASYGTSELLYTQSDADKIKYIRRNPAGNLWIEDEITSKGKKSIKYDAFVTTITLSDSVTKQPAAKFPVKVTSENLHVVANGVTYALSQKPTTLQTDASGSITIVIPSNKELGCPSLKITIDDQASTTPRTSSFSCEVEPSGRIDRLLGEIRTADNLKNAKSSSNTLPFQDMDPKVLENAASIIGSYGEAKSAMKDGLGHPGSGTSNTPKIIMGDIGSEPPSVLTAVKDTVLDFLGDAIEFLKQAVKSVTKVVLYVAGPILKFAFKIFGKWMSFTLKCLYNLLSAVGTCLKDVFGWDGLNKLLEYCRLAVDTESIKATQKVIKNVVLGSIQLTARIFDVNRSSISDLFEDGADFLKSFIDDPRDAPSNASKPAILQLISDILNNPFIKLIMKINPVSWIVEAITEQIPGIQMPSIADALGAITDELGETAYKQIDVLDQAMTTFYTQIQSVLNDPTKFWDAIQKSLQTIFWTLFDSLKTFMEGIYGIATAVIKVVGSVLDGVWKIPGITDLWEDFTGQDFSILGFMTFGPAVLANFIGLATNGKLPFEGKEELFDFNTVEVKPFYASSKKTQAEVKSRSMEPKAKTGTANSEAEPQVQPATLFANRAPMKTLNVENEIIVSSMSMRENSGGQNLQRLAVTKAGFGFFPNLRDISAEVKHIFSMIKYFAFAADNGWTIYQTLQNLPEQEENLQSWLSFFKLAGSFIASLMNLIQALPNAGEEVGPVHMGGLLLGLGGVGCAAYAFIGSRKPALDWSKGNDAEYFRELQLTRVKMCRELARWLGWIGSAIQILQAGPLNDGITWWHVTSPVASAGTWIAANAAGQNPSPHLRAALYIALFLALGNNLGLGGYHLYKAIAD